MKPIKRALISLKRRMGKTLILLCTIFVLGNIIAGAVSISEATNHVENQMKEQLGASANIDLDYARLGTSSTVEQLSPKKIEEIGRLKEVVDYSYSMSMPVGSKTLKPYTANSSEEFQGGWLQEGMEYTLFGDTGYQAKAIQDEKMKITEGRCLNKDDEQQNSVILSEELAKKNDIKVGDTIQLSASALGAPSDQGMNGAPTRLGEKEFSAEVVGLFQLAKKKANANGLEFLDDIDKNTIYSSLHLTHGVDDFTSKVLFDTYKKGSIDDYRSFITPTYNLKSHDVIDDFVSSAKKLIPESYKISTSAQSYEAIAGSLRNMQSLSTNVLYIGIIASVVVLSLILVLFFRERKHEFGLFKALGEPAISTILQVVIEVIVIAVIGVSLALFSGQKLAEGISRNMIENQLQSKQSEQGADGVVVIGGMDEQPTINPEELKENYKIVFNQNYIVSFYGIMILTAIGATVVPTIYLLRLKPKQILL